MEPETTINPQALQKEKQQIEKNLQNSNEPDRIKRLKEMQETVENF